MNEELKNELFDNLLPKDNLEIKNTPEYKALEYALDDDRITNIGITGNYGSGKSSFLLSFIKSKQLNEKCLNISLASFSDNITSNYKNTIANNDLNKSDDNIIKVKNIQQNSNPVNNSGLEEISKEKLQNIEIDILHQLIYKHSISELPNSRLPRITGFSSVEAKDLFKEIILALICISIIIISFIFPKNITFLTSDVIQQIRIFLFILGVITSTKPIFKFGIWLTKKIKNISFKKISFKNAEIELNSYKSDSILNQRLDEILYFFEQTKYEFVIFEDLDRFNNNKIFIHLREINKIINDNNKITRRIKFIYAVKDQMFKNEERVKFFDFIIPIIPIINSSSAASEIINQANHKPSYFEKIDQNYFTEIGSFINDMRLLKNIFNEYYIYHDKLSINPENNQKLFSLIVYKNLYPIDFSDMQQKKGSIQEVFDKKRDFISAFDKEINERINNHLDKIEKIRKEKLSSIFELRIIFVSEYMHQKGFNVTSNQIYSLCQTGFDNLMQGGGFIINEGYNGRPMSFEPKFFDNIRINNLTYSERAQIISNGIEKEIIKENNIIDKAKREQLKLFNTSVVDLCKIHSDFLDKFELTSIQKYFLKRGFIDENYRDYISIFHEGVLTISEYEYIMHVRNGEKTDYNLSITNTKQVIEKIKDIFINCTPALFNYDILNYLIKNKNEYKQELGFLIQYITEEEELKFLLAYITDCEASDFLSYAIINISDFWDNISNQNITSDSLNFICLKILKSLININIPKLNEEMISYINEHSEIFVKLNKSDDINGVFNVINQLGICFITLNEDLLKATTIRLHLFKNCCFKINFQNLSLISKYVNQKINGIYSKIIISGYEELKNYIKSNLRIVCQELFQKINVIEEDEVCFIEFVNSINETLDVKLDLLLRFKGKITFISEIKNKELYPQIFENNKFSITWENIISYYEYNGKQIDENIISFILDDENLSELENEKLMNEKLQNSYVSFLTALYQEERINESIVEKLENNNTFLLHKFNLLNISKEKLGILVNHKSIKFSKETLEDIRNIDTDIAINFVINNVEEYLKSDENIILSDKEIKELLYKKELGEKIKIKVFEKNINKACSVEPKSNLLQLIKQGNLYNKLDKSNVINLMNLKGFEFGPVNKELIPLKIELLLKTNELFTDDEICEILPIFNPDFKKIQTQHSVTIDNKKQNFDTLYEMLGERGIIISAKKSADKIILKIK